MYTSFIGSSFAHFCKKQRKPTKKSKNYLDKNFFFSCNFCMNLSLYVFDHFAAWVVSLLFSNHTRRVAVVLRHQPYYSAVPEAIAFKNRKLDGLRLSAVQSSNLIWFDLIWYAGWKAGAKYLRVCFRFLELSSVRLDIRLKRMNAKQGVALFSKLVENIQNCHSVLDLNVHRVAI